MSDEWWGKAKTPAPETTPDELPMEEPVMLQPPPLPTAVAPVEDAETAEPEALDPDMDGVLQISGAELLGLLDEAKKMARAEAEATVRDEVEAAVREEYTTKPVYQGLLGFFSWIAGKMPDSHGKPSGSWTLYVLSHLPILVYMACVCYGVVNNTNYKILTTISPWIPLFPLLLAWIAWLAHHRKVAEVVVMIVDSFGRALAAAKGGNMIATATTTVSAVLDQAKPDPKLKPGEKVALKPSPAGSKPKTDPNSLPMPPE